MNNAEDLHIENDKVNAPFLLAASFNGLIRFSGSYTNGNTLYLQFTPKDKALTLLDQLQTKTEPHIPAKDLFQATEFFWKQVAKTRNKGIKEYGELQ